MVRGRARFTAGEEVFEASEGSAVFVPEPVRRGAVALEARTVVLAVGGWRDRQYHSLPWEPNYLAQQHTRRGNWATATETLEREAGEHLQTAIQYRLACCHARLGQHDLALEELHEAIGMNPGMRLPAEAEDCLSPLRGLPGWPAASE